jgi:hypothetical protein
MSPSFKGDFLSPSPKTKSLLLCALLTKEDRCKTEAGMPGFSPILVTWAQMRSSCFLAKPFLSTCYTQPGIMVGGPGNTIPYLPSPATHQLQVPEDF